MRAIVCIAIACALGACGKGSRPAATGAPQATVETFATGAAFDGANGVYVGPDGNLYLASVITPGVNTSHTSRRSAGNAGAMMSTI